MTDKRFPVNNLKDSRTANILRNILKEQAITLKFLKKDGTERTMYCTTNLELIPVKDHPKPKPVIEVNEFTVQDVLKEPDPFAFKVYEINNGWRAFNLDQVIEWELS